MYCEMCGAVNPDDAKKCKKCGYVFNSSNKSSGDDFDKRSKKFLKDNKDVIYDKPLTEKVATGVEKGKTVAKKAPLGVKILVAVLAVALITFGVYYTIQTFNFFVPENGHYVYYKRINGKKQKAVSSRLHLRGNDYFVDENGYRVENTKHDEVIKGEKKTFFYNDEGKMIKGTWFNVGQNKCYATSDGSLAKNVWIEDSYLDDAGNMVKDGWVGKCYVDEEGKKKKSTWIGEKYYIEGNGDRAENKFLKFTDNTYYFDGEGIKQVDTLFNDINGDTYCADKSGNIIKDTELNYRFYDKDGKMLKNTYSPTGLKLDRYGYIIEDPLSQIHKQNYKFGSMVKFGSYEQDGNVDNGKEDIYWIVLHADNDKALLVSRDVLLCEPYQTKEFLAAGKNWDTSYLKNWLNGHFYASAFDDNEKKYFANDSRGKVSVMKIDEVENYFKNPLFRLSEPTSEAKLATENSKINKRLAPYWLMDGGVGENHRAFVSDCGDIVKDDAAKTINSYANNFIDTDKGDKVIAYSLTNVADTLMDSIKSEAVKQGAEIIFKTAIDASPVPSFIGDIAWDVIEKNMDKIVQPSGGSSNSGSSGSGKIDNVHNDQNAGPGVARVITADQVEQAYVPPKQTVYDNVYKDLGLITNEYMGVRPVIVLDVDGK